MFRNLFGSFKANKNTSVTEADKLFSFLASISHNPDAIENYLYQFNRLKRKHHEGEDRIYINLYLSWEEFIVVNQPASGGKQYTKDTLRQTIQQQIKINELDTEFQMVFLNHRAQTIKMYELFVKHLIDYISDTLGVQALTKALRNTHRDSFLAKIQQTGTTVSFDLIDRAVIPNTVDYPLDSVTKSFTYLVGALYNTIELSLGAKVTQGIFEKIFTSLKQTYNAELAAITLSIIPERVLGLEDWLSLMSKQELETQVRAKTEELQQFNESLESKVEQRTQELQKAYEDLKLLDDKKSEFISVAAHQLRTPLSGIKWSMGMLLNNELGNLTGEQREVLDQMNTTNDRVIGIINDLLDIDLLSRDKSNYTFSQVNLNTIITETLRDLEPQAKSKNVHIDTTEVQKDSLIVEADIDKIRIVFQNLIDNAIKYSDPDDTVFIQVRKVNTMVQIVIKDQGIGIPAVDQEEIFERFFRAENAVRKITEGSGVGLYIVKKVVEDHNGRIWFESAENTGTAFHVSIPVVRNLHDQGLHNNIAENVR
jgi:signal transduction histidine kinase